MAADSAAPPLAWHARLHFPDSASLREAGVCLLPACLASRHGQSSALASLLVTTPGCASSESDLEDGYTPLHWACCYGQLECVRLLLAHGASPDARSSDGWTPTSLAAGKGFPACLVACAAAGGDVNVRDSRGWTALHRAAWNGHTHCCLLLLTLCSPNLVHAVTKQGWTALHQASRFGSLDCVRALLSSGANIATPCSGASYQGWTALHLAANNAHSEVVAALLAAGAQADAREGGGATAQDCAARFISPAHRACVDLLDDAARRDCTFC
jgi:ankyrin repeat protein